MQRSDGRTSSVYVHLLLQKTIRRMKMRIGAKSVEVRRQNVLCQGSSPPSKRETSRRIKTRTIIEVGKPERQQHRFIA
jgi:hypothetical protein